MVAQKGKDLLLKIYESTSDEFVTVAGLRSNQITLNSDSVDVTDSESAGRWRELLAGAGVRRTSVSGSGIFKDMTSDETVRSSFFDGRIENWQIVIPDFGILTGPFQVQSLEYAGLHNAEITFDITLESAGEIQFGAI